MHYADFQEFLSDLDGKGDLRRIPVEVDPAGEIAEITDRVSKSCEPPALLFESVRGSRFPVATNVFGSFRRTALALGVDSLPQLVPLMERLIRHAGFPADEEEAWRLLAEKFPGLRPKLVEDGPCREVIEELPTLEGLPFLGNFAGDGKGGYLTLPAVFTRGRETGIQNCGMYRIRRVGADSLAIGWHPGSGGKRHFDGWRAAGRRMPVAVVLGGAPTTIFAAGFSFPPGADELHYAGLLQGGAVEVVESVGGIRVPATAELVLEGYLDPGEEASEGPFGNHTGLYAPQRLVPVMKVTRLTRRCSPVIPATVVGKPPAEDCYLAKAAERLLLPMLRLRFPEITELNFPMETIFHRGALISLRRGSDGAAVLRRLREKGPLREARLLVVVDEDINVATPAEAFWRAVNAAPFSAALVAGENRLDVDATLKGGAAPARRDPWIVSLVDSRWNEYFG